MKSSATGKKNGVKRCASYWNVWIATIRNFIEHKSFKVVEAKNRCWDEAPETYEIEQGAFFDKTMRLLRLTRSALIYLSSVIYEEESCKAPLDGEVRVVEMELL